MKNMRGWHLTGTTIGKWSNITSTTCCYCHENETEHFDLLTIIPA